MEMVTGMTANGMKIQDTEQENSTTKVVTSIQDNGITN